MIKIESKKNKFTYNVYHVTKAFYPKEDIVQTVDEKQEPLVKIHLPEGTCFSLAPEECVQTEDVQEEKRNVTKKVYQFLSKQTGQELAWGMLTGVRPTKLVMQKIEQGMTKEEIFEFLKEQYCVGDKKAQIAYEIACREKALLDQLDCKNGYSLYAGIPFCPSVCSYCSFSSSPIAEWKDQVDRYLDAMIKELKATAKLMQGKTLDTVYIGGGTPTTLEADQLDRLLGTIRENFDLEHVLEFTVEAGRPDSITREKLEVIRKYPVTRISVNPQTMQQKTLDLVGRKHTVEDVEQIFHLARELGFDNINMDLIAGLPGEDAADMQDTLEMNFASFIQPSDGLVVGFARHPAVVFILGGRNPRGAEKRQAGEEIEKGHQPQHRSERRPGRGFHQRRQRPGHDDFYDFKANRRDKRAAKQGLAPRTMARQAPENPEKEQIVGKNRDGEAD